MRIGTVLFSAFLCAALIPAVVFGTWSYRAGVEREFEEVQDRHLVIARNLGMVLSRYHRDVSGGLDTINDTLGQGVKPRNLSGLMQSLNLRRVFVVEEKTGKALRIADHDSSGATGKLSPAMLSAARDIAEEGETRYSQVIDAESDGNVVLAVQCQDGTMTIGVLGTDYFVNLSKSVSFGDRGHAAIVDQKGNILAHPNPKWVESRKNIAQVPAVQRMIRGETGIQQFYSPALKEDMIAGFASVSGPGWGVMIPQPVSELYGRVKNNYIAIIVATFAGVLLTLFLVILFIATLIRPLERFIAAIRLQAKSQKLEKIDIEQGLFRLKELRDFGLGYNALVAQINDTRDELESTAFTDGLTLLPTRDRLLELAQKAISNDSIETSGTFVFVDMDDFKQINDVHGHSVGDTYLKQCAIRLNNVVAIHLQDGGFESDHDPVVARIGGDEFAILVPGLSEEGEVHAFLNEVQQELARPCAKLPFLKNRNASIGAARYPNDTRDVAELMKLSDIAMYHAKRSGKGRSQLYFKEIGVMTENQLKQSVEEAILDEQMVVEYQPKICTKTGEISGVEALVRWLHPTQGLMPASEWIPAIAQTPIIRQLGDCVVNQTFADLKRWTVEGVGLNVAINIGSDHFCYPQFAEWIIERAEEFGVDPHQIELEVTEDTLSATDGCSRHTFEALRNAGFKVSIDDFGTGYSNFARLSKLPVDSVKIDRSVVHGALDDTRINAMMECIVMMAKRLGCSTVAEGIETQEQIELARECGIDHLQGFFFAKSMSSDALMEWLDQHRQRQRVGYAA